MIVIKRTINTILTKKMSYRGKTFFLLNMFKRVTV